MDTSPDHQQRSDHAATYRKGTAKWVHRNRLGNLIEILDGLPHQDDGHLCDLGCSDGFILSQLRELPALEAWHFSGFDNKANHIDAAQARQIRDTEFATADLNLPNPELRGRFDLTLCLETLEHVGNYRAGLKNVVSATRSGGHIIISVPNESGLAGVVKYAGRRFTRRNPYGDFFKERSERQYVKDLVLGRRLDTYRQPERWGWAPHLGFDVSVFEEHLKSTYVGKKCDLLERRSTGGIGFNLFYVLEVR